jgi:glyoxylase-like metal-dependent hydrolase (beta-lactamase superfamily II)
MSAPIQLNDITIHPVIEQQGNWFNVMEFFPTLTKELLDENRSWMEPTFLDPANNGLVLCIQSFVIKTPHHNILIDSCVGNHKPRPTRPFWNMLDSDRFNRSLAATGLAVDDIDFVMCTHMHVDHVGWNTRLVNGRWVPTFPNARYVFGKTEFDCWSAQHASAPVAQFGDSVLPVVEAGQAEIVQDGYEIGDHMRILPTPGHTPGHAAFTFGCGRDHAVVSGDLTHSPLQMRYPELSVKFDVDPVEAAVTRRNFLERYCDTDTLCCTAHFPSPSAGKIRRLGDGFCCEPVAG